MSNCINTFPCIDISTNNNYRKVIKQHFYEKIYAVCFFLLLTALFPVLAQNNKILFTGGNVKKTDFP